MNLPNSSHRMIQVVLSIVLGIVVAVSGVDALGSNRRSDRAETLALTDLSIVANPSAAYVDQEITFFANASSDIVGATLTFTIYYDYLDKPFPTVNAESAYTVNTTSNPGTVVTKHTYDTIGNYTAGGRYFFWVYLFVDDGMENLSTIVQVRVNYNTAPVLLSPPENPMIAFVGVQKNISVLIADADSDLVTVHWDYGDGTNSTNVTVAPPFPPGATVNVSHIWTPTRIPGYGPYFAAYWLNVSISDGINAPVNYSADVNVSVGVNWPPTLDIKASQTVAIIDALNPTATINFTANASDPEGDPLTWTFNYSDGSPLEVYQYTAWTASEQLMWQNTTHVFSAVGNYTVNISVSDALVPNQIGYHNATMSISLRLIYNTPPFMGSISVSGYPMINSTTGFTDVSFSFEAVDPDGDVMTVTWKLDGEIIGTNVSGGTTAVYYFQQVIRFNETGTYNVSATITDGRPGHDQFRYKMISVISSNLPPDVLVWNHTVYRLGDFASREENLTFNIVLRDPEKDAIELSIDFGDGTPWIFTNLTDYGPDGNITVQVSHAYVNIGDFTVRLNVTDNKLGILNHTKSYTIPIHVRFALTLAAGWNLVSFPVSMSYYAGNLPGLKTGDVVARWNTVSQTYDRICIRGVSPSSMDFLLEPNLGYWVYSASPKSFSLRGSQVTSSQTIPITVAEQGGWVLVGLRSMKSTFSAESFPGMYIGGNVSRVESWNLTTESYVSHLVGGPVNDFRLMPGEGYWIYVDRSGILTYDP